MKPLRRIEHFLAKIAGSEDAEDLTPINRKEYWLNEIAKNVSGGGSGSGAKVLTLYVDAANTTSRGWHKAYKDPEMTQEFESFEEAKAAAESADIIKAFILGVDLENYPTVAYGNYTFITHSLGDTVTVGALNGDVTFELYYMAGKR